jgi:mannosyltransferase OCH1-like enzyme
MGKDHPLFAHYYQEGISNEQGQQTLCRLKGLFNKNYIVAQKTDLKIPKKIHQIWLGSQLPEKFKYYQSTWQLHHPDWEYKLWTDNDIAAFGLENQQAYDNAINYAEKSDIARYEILFRLGGLYVDTDFECLKPFDTLHHCYDFYTGLELPAMAMFVQAVIIPNGLIGSTESHPIIRACIDAIKKQTYDKNNHDVVAKTGPLLFTNIILSTAGTHENLKDIIFPASYFYPIDKKTKDRNCINSCIQPETYAIHHWAGSWILREEAFVPGIKIRCKQEGNIIKFLIADERK